MDPEATRQDVTSDPDKYVDTSIDGPYSQRDIGDTNNRVALGPSFRVVDLEVLNLNDALRWDLTINEPGRYLIICTLRPHFPGPRPRSQWGNVRVCHVALRTPPSLERQQQGRSINLGLFYRTCGWEPKLL